MQPRCVQMPIRTSHCSWPACTRAESGAGSCNVCQFTSRALSMSRLLRWKIKIGLLRQNTLTIWPSAMGARLTSSGPPAAMVEASGSIWPISGTRAAAAPTAATVPVATRRKSRREGSAAEIVVTVSILVRLAGHSIRAANRPPSPQPPGCGRRKERVRRRTAALASNLGETRSNAIRRRFIGTLTAGAQVCPPTRLQGWRSGLARPAAPMRIALYQPDIPQNTGTILRLCACLGIEAHLIGPAGFPTSDRAFRRAGMDYLDAVVIVRHRSWRDFESWRGGTEGHRLVLFTTTGARSYLDYRY